MKRYSSALPAPAKAPRRKSSVKSWESPAISTGNIIREALKNGTEMGLRAKSYMESGALVPTRS